MTYPENNGTVFSVNAPQLENGYTRIANELLEAVAKVNLPNEAMRVFLAIIRLTYGWNRKEAIIRNYELCEITGIKQQHIKRAISKLTNSYMVKVTSSGNKSYPSYCINKNYEEWQTVTSSGNKLPRQVTKVTSSGNTELPRQVTDTPLKPLPDKGSSDPKDIKDIKDIKDSIYIYWNSLEIIVHRDYPSCGKSTLQNILDKLSKNYTEDEIKQTILNYKKILDSDQHFFNYKWGLADFLQRGFEKFVHWDVADQNYKIRIANGKPKRLTEAERTEQRRQEIMSKLPREHEPI